MKTKHEAQHTPGVVRAAHLICCLTEAHRKQVVIAAIIDRETCAPELLAALENLIYATEHYYEVNPLHVKAVSEARAALSKAKGGQP